MLAASLLAGCGGDASGDPVSGSAPPAGTPLDCGQGRHEAKDAVREFLSVLRSGDEQAVLRTLATGGRFEWISVHDKRGNPIVEVRGRHRRRAAAAVADVGGLPLRVTEFMNIDRPSRTTDFGFWGKWNGRKAAGKGAIDCEQGRARVLSVGLPFELKG